jgi:hypothetical protein
LKVFEYGRGRNRKLEKTKMMKSLKREECL